MSSKDVDMDGGVTEEKKTDELPKVEDPNLALWIAICGNLRLLAKGVARNDQRILSRVFRNTSRIRVNATPYFLKLACEEFLTESNVLSTITAGFDSAQEALGGDTSGVQLPENFAKLRGLKDETLLPETELYFYLLAASSLIKNDIEASEFCSGLVAYAESFNRRSMDMFTARAFELYSFSKEKAGDLSSIRNHLLTSHRTACVRRNDIGQATLLNLLLRNYLHYNMVPQASKLESHCEFPSSCSSTGQLLRYLFYTGRLAALTLDYGRAVAQLTQAQRKAPSNTGQGFRVQVAQLLAVVQLLTGEIPDRAALVTPGSRAALRPYLLLTQAVRVGDLAAYSSLLQEQRPAFAADRTLALVSRLRASVIKAGLRSLGRSYSCISLAAAAARLRLQDAATAELVCAKAIRDGVIDAEIDHDNQTLSSREAGGLYSTAEPQRLLHSRIQFLQDVRSEAVRAMRYPPGAFKHQKEGRQDPHALPEGGEQEGKEQQGKGNGSK